MSGGEVLLPLRSDPVFTDTVEIGPDLSSFSADMIAENWPAGGGLLLEATAGRLTLGLGRTDQSEWRRRFDGSQPRRSRSRSL